LTLAARGLKRNISNASVLHTHNNRAVLKNGEMNSIAGLEIRSGPHFFGDSGLTFTGNCCECHIGLHPFLRLVILQGSRFCSSIPVFGRFEHNYATGWRISRVGGPATKIRFFILRMPKRVTEVKAHRGFGRTARMRRLGQRQRETTKSGAGDGNRTQTVCEVPGSSDVSERLVETGSI
jgi:hypothetical protein